MKIWLVRIGLGLGGLVVVLLIVGLSLLWGLNYHPKKQMKAERVCSNNAPLLQPGATLRILSWNIQYAASRKYHFFYDDGKAVYPELKDVKETLTQLVEAVKKYKPDVILWQEVDRDSDRTGRIDQLKRLLEGVPYRCWAATPYHWSRYLPFPSHKHLGRINLQLVVFSKYRIVEATRFALPMLHESFIRRAFNLKRAVLRVRLPIQGSKQPLTLFDTHFSAFSFGDGTMRKQVKRFIELAQEAEKAGGVWLGGGDMNLLPPGVDPQTLGKDAKLYPKKNNPSALFFKKLRPVLPLATYRKDPSAYHTYLPFGAKNPDRWIDYLFAGSRIKVLSYKVLQEMKAISDHLPLLVEIKLP